MSGIGLRHDSLAVRQVVDHPGGHKADLTFEMLGGDPRSTPIGGSVTEHPSGA